MTQAGSSPPIESVQSSAVLFWTLLEETVLGQTETERRKPRMAYLNIPLCGATLTPSIGWVHSIGVGFNCRIVGYQIFSLVTGQLSIDIQKSDPVTHPSATFDPQPLQFPSLIGDVSMYPSINGVYADSFDGATDLTLWESRDLAIGDMLHFYIMATDGLPRQTALMLYLQDLDEKT